MNQVCVAVDASDATLGQHRMRLTARIALWFDCAGLVTTAARNTVPASELRKCLLLERHPPGFPSFGIAEIVRRFNINVANARCNVNVSLEKPVSSWDMAIAATRPHALVVADMRGFLKIRIIRLQRHSMTTSAKGVRRGGMVDGEAHHHAAGAYHRSDEQ